MLKLKIFSKYNKMNESTKVDFRTVSLNRAVPDLNTWFVRVRNIFTQCSSIEQKVQRQTTNRNVEEATETPAIRASQFESICCYCCCFVLFIVYSPSKLLSLLAVDVTLTDIWWLDQHSSNIESSFRIACVMCARNSSNCVPNQRLVSLQ